MKEMRGEPLKDKEYDHNSEMGDSDYVYAGEFNTEDVASAIQWLKKEIWTNTSFIEHLTEKQQEELRNKIDEAFPDVTKGDEKK